MAELEENVELMEDYLDEDTQKDRYLSFIIDDEEYAIEIKHVIEIVGIQKITRVPNIKPFIKGIISLRGTITPVVDVRARFSLPPIPYDDRTCIIIVTLGTSEIGLIVDEVQEVISIPEDNISNSPQTTKGNHGRFISGIGKVGNAIKILLNIDKLLYDDEDIMQTTEENFQ